MHSPNIRGPGAWTIPKPVHASGTVPDHQSVPDLNLAYLNPSQTTKHLFTYESL